MKDKKEFIKQLASFLVKDQGSKSIHLEMSHPIVSRYAEEWQKLRATTPLFGYPTEYEAEQQLTAWLLQ